MVKVKLEKIAKSLEEELRNLSDFIYDHPELGLEEFQSSKAHVDLLKEHGFEVEIPYLGFETAFRAVFDSGQPGPTIAYLSEYDALPGIGHGCGHNLLGTVNTGAGIALSKLLKQTGGRVIVLGTPAEETNGIKVDMANANTFDDIDVALCSHPASKNEESGTSLAMDAIRFEFYGKAAHAAAAPWEGINALDGVINLFNMINSMRQSIKPSARIHGVISHGGEAANVIPEYACADFYVRASRKPYLRILRDRVIACAEAAALASGARMEWSYYEKSYDDMITNQPLSQTFNQHAADLGMPMEPHGQDTHGSLDTGNVSQVVPAIHPYYDITEGVPLGGHTPEFRDATKTPYAYQVMLKMVQALAHTGYDVLTQPDLLANIREAFNKVEK